MKMAQGVLVICEQRDGAIRKISYEAVSEGRRQADGLNTDLTALVLGSGVVEMAADLEKYGPDKILVADDPNLANYSTDSYLSVCTHAIKNQDPMVIITGASSQGKDLSARLAARLDAGLVMDCVAIQIENNQLTYIRPMFGGKVLAEVNITETPHIVAIRSNVMAITESPRTCEIDQLDIQIDVPKTKVIDQKLESGDKVELTEADVIVSGGRGTGGNYDSIEELAALLNGAVGASRSAVDEGWRPHSDQVGQTGKVVSPNLYVACGISGAIQHLAGMSTSKNIVAINKDPEAPIFSKADYGVVSDLFEILPEIIKEVKKIRE
jgi:electron transfer flavoprotein alpha subunit